MLARLAEADDEDGDAREVAGEKACEEHLKKTAAMQMQRTLQTACDKDDTLEALLLGFEDAASGSPSNGKRSTGKTRMCGRCDASASCRAASHNGISWRLSNSIFGMDQATPNGAGMWER